MAMSSEWIDVTVPLENGMVHWEGDPEVKIYRHFELGVDGMPCNLTKLEISAHTATHMDAMCHFVPGGAGMDEMPLEATIGPCRVIGMDVEDQITPSDLEGLNLQQGERIIFKTHNTTRSWDMAPVFDRNFVSISEAAGKVLAEAGVMTVGVDYLSIGGFGKDVVEVHQVMLGAGIWVIEGLRLVDIDPGDYDLLCLPLKIKGADGAPCRALLKPR
jgi:arylformamidase